MKLSQPTAPSKRLLYPNLSTKLPLRGSINNEQYINDNILANNKFNSKINTIKDIKNYYDERY